MLADTTIMPKVIRSLCTFLGWILLGMAYVAMILFIAGSFLAYLRNGQGLWKLVAFAQPLCGLLLPFVGRGELLGTEIHSFIWWVLVAVGGVAASLSTHGGPFQVAIWYKRGDRSRLARLDRVIPSLLKAIKSHSTGLSRWDAAEALFGREVNIDTAEAVGRVLERLRREGVLEADETAAIGDRSYRCLGMPAPPGELAMIPRSAGELVPEGYIRARDQRGNLWALSPQAAVTDDDPTELTPEQIRRIRRFKEIFAEHDQTSLDEALANFRRDRTPEKEIQVWERMARVFEEELKVRPEADSDERSVLFKVIFACSFGSSVQNVLWMAPRAKSLPNLARVLERYSLPDTG